MAKTFAILAQGSSFMHGSNTNNGGSADVRINDLFAYVAYQVAAELICEKVGHWISNLFGHLTCKRKRTAGNVINFFTMV